MTFLLYLTYEELKRYPRSALRHLLHGELLYLTYEELKQIIDNFFWICFIFKKIVSYLWGIETPYEYCSKN